MHRRTGIPQLLRYGTLGLAGILLLIVLACGDDATSTPLPTSTPQPTATATPQPTPTLAPTPLAMPKGKQCCIVPMTAGTALSHWDPQACNVGNSCLTNTSPMFNGLMEGNPETDDQTDIRGDLAKSWEVSEDGLTYTFALHDARWHDGTPVTARDVVFSLNRMVIPDAPRRYTGQLGTFFKTARVIDVRTVEVETKFVAAAFLPFLASQFFAMMPRHHYEGLAQEDAQLQENVMGSGPFLLVDHTKDVSFEHTRNPDYFKEGLPYFDGIEHFIITEPGRVAAAFKAQQVLTQDHPSNNMSTAANIQLGEDMKGKGKVFLAGPIALLFVQYNTLRAPFDNVKVRRAINLALHRQQYIETFSAGKDLLGAPMPPGTWFGLPEEEVRQLPGYRELNGEKHPDDIAEAKKLLAEAGFPDGFDTSITTFKLIEFPDMIAMFADQMRRFLNINVDLQALEFVAAFQLLEANDFAMFQSGFNQLVMDPADVVGGMYVLGGRNNNSDWSHPRIEELHVQQQSELDQGRRRLLVREIADILLNEDIPYAHQNWTMRGMYVDDRIHNFHPPINLDDQLKHEHLWCDPECP